MHREDKTFEIKGILIALIKHLNSMYHNEGHFDSLKVKQLIVTLNSYKDTPEFNSDIFTEAKKLIDSLEVEKYHNNEDLLASIDLLLQVKIGLFNNK
jgi:hypothetical protein